MIRPAQARPTARNMLRGHAHITAPPIDTVDDDGNLESTPGPDRYLHRPGCPGCATLLPPASTARRSDAGADDIILSTRILIIDPDLDQGIQTGDIVNVDGHGTLTVHHTGGRTNEVLRRISVIDPADAEQVPR